METIVGGHHLPPWCAVRVAYTLEQSWHRVPGGTAVAALEVAKRLAPHLIGVTAAHRHPPPPPWTPPIRVRAVPLPRPALYDAWLWLRTPPVQLVTGRVDVIHATTIVVPPHTAPLVVTVHDLAFLHEPDHFTARGQRVFRRGLDLVRRRADLVLASSLATMADAEAAGIGAERLRHVPLGVAVAPADPDARHRFGLDRPYLLFVGTLEPRKNLARLVEAVGRLRTDHVLAVAGLDGWGDASPPAGDRVRLLGFVTDAERDALYAGAAAFVYPSLREGFGLPVAEAMAHGTPVVTSRGTSTEEVAAGAAVLVEPTDVDAIVDGIERALADRDRLVAAGLLRAAELTWEHTAEATLAAYRELAG
jgi:glycosyltransferase involved in cell wall biosynthesis